MSFPMEWGNVAVKSAQISIWCWYIYSLYMHRVYRIQFTSGGNEIKRNESSSLTSLTALFLFASQEALQEKRRRQETRMDGEMAPVKLLKQPPGKLLRKRFRKVRAAVEPEVTVVAATSWARVNLQQSVAKCLSGKWLQKKHNRKVGKNNEKKNHPPTLPLPCLVTLSYSMSF